MNEKNKRSRKAFERILPAFFLAEGSVSLFPSSMEARGAPPVPAKALKADIS